MSDGQLRTKEELVVAVTTDRRSRSRPETAGMLSGLGAGLSGAADGAAENALPSRPGLPLRSARGAAGASDDGWPRPSYDAWRCSRRFEISCPGSSGRSVPSSSGQGHHPLKVATRVRIPLGLLKKRHPVPCSWPGMTTFRCLVSG